MIKSGIIDDKGKQVKENMVRAQGPALPVSSKISRLGDDLNNNMSVNMSVIRSNENRIIDGAISGDKVDYTTINHDALLNYEAKEHIDWTATGPFTIDESNYVETDPVWATDSQAIYDGDINYPILRTPEIKSDTTTPTDLKITTGAAKTLLLGTVVWDDLRVTPGSFDRPGVSGPVYVAYAPGGGALSCYLPEFAVDDFASFTVQLPHSYKQGSDISVHIHWTAGTRGNEESGKLVGWKIDYSWANINGTFASMQTADLSDECAAADHTHQMTPEVTIDGHTSEKHISSMLLCTIKRTDTGTDDTWVGTASGSLPLLLEVDFHFPIDTMGSRSASSK
jgi:hypothetical protein